MKMLSRMTIHRWTYMLIIAFCMHQPAWAAEVTSCAVEYRRSLFLNEELRWPTHGNVPAQIDETYRPVHEYICHIYNGER